MTFFDRSFDRFFDDFFKRASPSLTSQSVAAGSRATNVLKVEGEGRHEAEMLEEEGASASAARQGNGEREDGGYPAPGGTPNDVEAWWTGALAGERGTLLALVSAATRPGGRRARGLGARGREGVPRPRKRRTRSLDRVERGRMLIERPRVSLKGFQTSGRRWPPRSPRSPSTRSPSSKAKRSSLRSPQTISFSSPSSRTPRRSTGSARQEGRSSK